MSDKRSKQDVVHDVIDADTNVRSPQARERPMDVVPIQAVEPEHRGRVSGIWKVAEGIEAFPETG